MKNYKQFLTEARFGGGSFSDFANSFTSGKGGKTKFHGNVKSANPDKYQEVHPDFEPGKEVASGYGGSDRDPSKRFTVTARPKDTNPHPANIAGQEKRDKVTQMGHIGVVQPGVKAPNAAEYKDLKHGSEVHGWTPKKPELNMKDTGTKVDPKFFKMYHLPKKVAVNKLPDALKKSVENKTPVDPEKLASPRTEKDIPSLPIGRTRPTSVNMFNNPNVPVRSRRATSAGESPNAKNTHMGKVFKLDSPHIQGHEGATHYDYNTGTSWNKDTGAFIHNPPKSAVVDKTGAKKLTPELEQKYKGILNQKPKEPKEKLMTPPKVGGKKFTPGVLHKPDAMHEPDAGTKTKTDLEKGVADSLKAKNSVARDAMVGHNIGGDEKPVKTVQVKPTHEVDRLAPLHSKNAFTNTTPKPQESKPGKAFKGTKSVDVWRDENKELPNRGTKLDLNRGTAQSFSAKTEPEPHVGKHPTGTLTLWQKAKLAATLNKK